MTKLTCEMQFISLSGGSALLRRLQHIDQHLPSSSFLDLFECPTVRNINTDISNSAVLSSLENNLRL